MKRLVRVWDNYVLYCYGIKGYRLIPISGGTTYDINADNDASAIIQSAALVKEKDDRTWN